MYECMKCAIVVIITVRMRGDKQPYVSTPGAAGFANGTCDVTSRYDYLQLDVFEQFDKQ